MGKGDQGNDSATSRYSTKGTYGLKTCFDGESAGVDIVFVHGLTGNRETTWLHKSSGTFWPAHLLKDDIPRARIVTFGYDADVVHFWAMSSQNHIRNHATNLINALAQLRLRTETTERPILFVTHSLGGLTVQDALLASRSSAENRLQNIFHSTRGICFLGTPHCGSTLANWASIFGSISGVVKTTNTNLLGVLQPGSEVLARIQTEFHQMLRTRAHPSRPTMEITCFYEELPVRGIGEIVPKHSAILPAFNNIGIHANHMDMTKFSRSDDTGYLSVSTELLLWYRAILRETNNVGPSLSGIGSQRSGSLNANDGATEQEGRQRLLPSSVAYNPVYQGSHVFSGEIHNHGKATIGNNFQIHGPASF